jgi:hypothetical protein
MEPEGSFPRSQEPDTDHYPEPDEPNPHPDVLFLQDPFILPSGLFPTDIPSKFST